MTLNLEEPILVLTELDIIKHDIKRAVKAYDKENPVRTVDAHDPDYCVCLRCSVDLLRVWIE